MTVVAFAESGPAHRLPVANAALFVDLDGTLVGLVDRPSEVKADAACIDLVRRATDVLDNRLAVLSGRSIDGVDAILEGAVAHVAGVHGLQHRTARWGVVETKPEPAVAAVAEILDILAGARPGLLVERKGHSVAIHYRLAPEAGDAVVEAGARLAEDAGLTVQHGAMVVELRPPGPDKGVALRRFMGLPPFAGARPIMIGDDLTDEAAFVEARMQGGVSLLVGSQRPTAANGRLADPQAVQAWIARGLDAGAFDLAEAQWAA